MFRLRERCVVACVVSCVWQVKFFRMIVFETKSYERIVNKFGIVLVFLHVWLCGVVFVIFVTYPFQHENEFLFLFFGE